MTGAILGLLVRRDLARAVARPAEALLPTAFFLLVAITFAFALGPAPSLLARAGPGVIWVGALLASLLPVQSLYASDIADGTLDQLASRRIAAETIAAARLLSGFVVLAAPLLAALPLAALLLGIPPAELPRHAAALALGSLGLAALANIVGALTVGARGGGGLAALLVVPLALPLLIFGSAPAAPGALRLVAGTALLLAAVAPFAAALGLRLARS